MEHNIMTYPMKRIEEYMEEELGLKPLGEIKFEECTDGEDVGNLISVGGKIGCLEVWWVDYASFLEKKLSALEEKYEKLLEKTVGEKVEKRAYNYPTHTYNKFHVGDIVTYTAPDGSEWNHRKITDFVFDHSKHQYLYTVDPLLVGETPYWLVEENLKLEKEEDKPKFEVGQTVSYDNRLFIVQEWRRVHVVGEDETHSYGYRYVIENIVTGKTASVMEDRLVFVEE